MVFFCVDLHCDLFPDCVATVLTAEQLLTSCPLSLLRSGQTVQNIVFSPLLCPKPHEV